MAGNYSHFQIAVASVTKNVRTPLCNDAFSRLHCVVWTVEGE